MLRTDTHDDKLQDLAPCTDQTLNFTFVLIQQRVGFVQIVAIFWNAYLSWMAN